MFRVVPVVFRVYLLIGRMLLDGYLSILVVAKVFWLFLGCCLVVKNIWVVARVVTKVFGVVAEQLLNVSVLKLSWRVLASIFFLKMQIPRFFVTCTIQTLNIWFMSAFQRHQTLVAVWCKSSASTRPFHADSVFCSVFWSAKLINSPCLRGFPLQNGT